MTQQPLFIIPSIATGGAELLLMVQIEGLRRRGLEPRLIVLSDQVDCHILARAGLPEDHLLLLGARHAVMGIGFLRDCPGLLRPAADFVARQPGGPIVAILPPAHFLGRLLKVFLLARRRVRLIQYHRSEENRLGPRDTLAKRAFHAVNRLLCRICDDAHWHISRQVQEDVARYMPVRNNAVIFNSCDMDSPPDPAADRILAGAIPESSAYTILQPARLHAVKGHGLLIDAVRRMVEAENLGPGQLRLVFAGDGPERDRIEAALAAAGLRDHAVLLGTVPHSALLTMYRHFDAVVLPSLSEGFGNAAIEAIAQGALLIASDAGGLAEIVKHGENGLQFRAGDAGALYRVLHEAWSRRGESVIDREAAVAGIRERFGLDGHLGRMIALLEGRDESGSAGP